MTPEEAANIRFLCNTTLQEYLKNEVGNLLYFKTPPTKRPAIHRGTPPAPSPKNSNLLPQSNPPPSYLEKDPKAHLHPDPIIPPKCTNYGISRDLQIHLQLSHKITDEPPNETKDWINRLCSDMVARTLKSVASESKNNLGKSWSPVWIPFHYRVDGVTPIYFHTPPPGLSIRLKKPKVCIGIVAESYSTEQASENGKMMVPPEPNCANSTSGF